MRRRDQRVAESVDVGKARRAARRGSSSPSSGSVVGLLVADHLQAVLDAAQEEIGLGEIARGLARRSSRLAASRSSVSSVPRRRSSGLPAAGDQLLGLDEELDLADAAAAELDVVAGDRDLAVALDGVDLPLDRVDVGDGGVVEIFAPDVGRELGEEGLARLDVAGDRRAP